MARRLPAVVEAGALTTAAAAAFDRTKVAAPAVEPSPNDAAAARIVTQV